MLHKQSIHQKISSPPKKYIIKKKVGLGMHPKKASKDSLINQSSHQIQEKRKQWKP
jgi:hypothetical protein